MRYTTYNAETYASKYVEGYLMGTRVVIPSKAKYKKRSKASIPHSELLTKLSYPQSGSIDEEVKNLIKRQLKVHVTNLARLMDLYKDTKTEDPRRSFWYQCQRDMDETRELLEKLDK